MLYVRGSDECNGITVIVMIPAVGRVKTYDSDDVLEGREDDGSGSFSGSSHSFSCMIGCHQYSTRISFHQIWRELYIRFSRMAEHVDSVMNRTMNTLQ